MAKEYITYDEYLSRARKQAQEQQAAYASERERAAAETVKALTTAEMAGRTQIQQETAQKIDAAKASYQALYDENAVREKAAQLNVEETLANMGLSDSGLSRTQQTALAAVRARADAQVSLKKQQAVDTLLQEMTAAIEKNREALKAAENAELAAAKEDVEQNRLALEKEAQTAATTQFNADLKAADQLYEQEMQDKKFAQEVKEWQAEEARQNAKIAADVALQKQKQADATALEKLKQANATALQKQKQTDSTTLQKQKQADATALQKQKQADATALQKQKTNAETTLAAKKTMSAVATSKTLSGAQRAELTESLRKALKERSEIYDQAMRADYDQLIAYYESILY